MLGRYQAAEHSNKESQLSSRKAIALFICLFSERKGFLSICKCWVRVYTHFSFQLTAEQQRQPQSGGKVALSKNDGDTPTCKRQQQKCWYQNNGVVVVDIAVTNADYAAAAVYVTNQLCPLQATNWGHCRHK